MRLAVWNYPPADFIVSGVTTGAVNDTVEVERHSPRQCTELLLQGQVDVALVPTLLVLSHPDQFDVLPGVAFSTWSYPYARIVLRKGLEDIRSVAYDPAHVQEVLLARIVLHEHYRKEPEFVPYEGASLEQLLEASEDASLLVGTGVSTLQTEYLELDLGREWYELAHYPMVWGVFAVRKEEAVPGTVRALRRVIRTAEQQRPVWMQAQETSPDLHTFFRDDLRLRFDDLAMASLTEFRQFLYFYKVVDEIPELPLVAVPDEELDDDDPEPLL